MNTQVLIAIVGLVGALIGAIITSIPILIQEHGAYKRWRIEKRIEYLKEQIGEIDEAKKTTLVDFYNTLYGKKIDNHNFVTSVPMEVIEAIKKHLPDGKTMIADLPDEKKQIIFTDAASALENKKIELSKNIKKLLS